MRIEPTDKGFDLMIWAISAAISGTLVYLVLLGWRGAPPHSGATIARLSSGPPTAAFGPRRWTVDRKRAVDSNVFAW